MSAPDDPQGEPTTAYVEAVLNLDGTLTIGTPGSETEWITSDLVLDPDAADTVREQLAAGEDADPTSGPTPAEHAGPILPCTCCKEATHRADLDTPEGQPSRVLACEECRDNFVWFDRGAGQ